MTRDEVRLRDFILDHNPLCVITGAGCSTASGIYDYRDQQGEWKRPEPVYLHDFLHLAAARRKYWARSMLGYPRFAQAQPNQAHYSLVKLEQRGFIRHLITQNVDDLHEDAGQQNVTKLHGSLASATCINCGTQERRAEIQSRLELINRRYLDNVEYATDGGEASFTIPIDETFCVPSCLECGGIIQPDVVFFGGAVSDCVKRTALAAVLDARGLILLGTTAQVFSCYQLVREAHRRGIAIAAINKGKMRTADLLEFQISEAVEDLLPRVEQQI